MPVVGGMEVFRALRASRWTTPTIIVTGHESPEVEEMADRLGAIVLPKPLDLELFESTVRELLASPRGLPRADREPDSRDERMDRER